MAVGAVGGVDEERGCLGYRDVPDRAVVDPFGEQAFEPDDVPGPGADAPFALVEEPRVGLVVQSTQEREVALGHVADRLQCALEPLEPRALACERGLERLAEVPLVVAREQGEDLLPAEPAAMQSHTGKPRRFGDPRERRALPAVGRYCALGTCGDARRDIFGCGGSSRCHRVTPM